ncbi:putative ATP-dependent transporter [Candidatus Clavichlamydia salmonicola]|uniref:Fe-S cluster assembly ATPase SufC n=1 Tax=Candidatus Clavichlamydia salmonicola TaxID=469812 RepID=UPI0018915659|nr:Fe-S cluster assembly ATPase SufC [Candidatus Clavichlamydia salmonicola]MBF5050718.1 putative ATP-dependent transporter [Candidatus Clavichlamydia salmonicola]
MLTISDLQVSNQGNVILKGVNLEIFPGKRHVIMGPNGSGKSTLARVLAGDPAYEVIGGKILFQGEDITMWSPEERSLAGIFMSFQYPSEIPGVSNETFFLEAYNTHRLAHKKSLCSEVEFQELLNEIMKQLGIGADFKSRGVNEGFSGGEKKRNEILQMILLKPALSILDETDSGLDVDALRIVAKSLSQFFIDNPKSSMMLITHYRKFSDYVDPDFIHILSEGRIVKSGSASLGLELEELGYDKLIGIL